MKIDINVALLGYIRSKDLELGVSAFKDLLIAIDAQVSENELQAEINKHVKKNFSENDKICVDNLKSKEDNCREENFAAESNY